MRKKENKVVRFIIALILIALVVVFLYPIFIVLINSFKSRIYIYDAPFSLPNFAEGVDKTFVGLENYKVGIIETDFLTPFLTSLFITVASVAVIILCTSMCAWFITRVKSKVTSTLYYLFVFSMIVPFQMVMFPISKVTSTLNLDNPLGIVLVYLGFGAGLSVFMFSGFIKSIPLDVEEAAIIDGCSPIQMYFKVIFPILKPTAITVAILNAMWIWNDYLLPKIVLSSDYNTIPTAVQGVLTGSYGSKDMGALMAMLVVSIIPIIIFYIACQKHIIKGVMSGAVKG